MRSGNPWFAATVGVALTAAAIVFFSGGTAAHAQPTPASSTTTTDTGCLSIEPPASPSAGSLSPIADGGASAGRIERLGKLVRGASACTLRPVVGGNLRFADPALAQVGALDDMRMSLNSRVRTPYEAMLQHATRTRREPTTTFELGSAAPPNDLQAATPVSLGLPTSEGGAAPMLEAPLRGSSHTQSWSDLDGAPSMAGGSAPLHGLSSGLAPSHASPVAPLLAPGVQPFSSRILIQSSVGAGMDNP